MDLNYVTPAFKLLQYVSKLELKKSLLCFEKKNKFKRTGGEFEIKTHLDRSANGK